MGRFQVLVLGLLLPVAVSEAVAALLRANVVLNRAVSLCYVGVGVGVNRLIA